jgi:hypothetical protein
VWREKEGNISNEPIIVKATEPFLKITPRSYRMIGFINVPYGKDVGEFMGA